MKKPFFERTIIKIVRCMMGTAPSLAIALAISNLVCPNLIMANQINGAAIISAPDTHASEKGKRAKTNADQLSEKILRAQDELKALREALIMAAIAGLVDGGPVVRAHKDTLHEIRQSLVTLHRSAQQEFHEVLAHLNERALPQEAFTRHEQAAQGFENDMGFMMSRLASIQGNHTLEEVRGRVDELIDFLDNQQLKRAQLAVNPAQLPFSVAEKTQIEPYSPENKTLASEEAKLGAAVSPQDTAPNTDVQLTPEIVALAASLNNNPVKILNWVHNNIAYIPTHGSIQGSQMTLVSRQGNACDTSSLLIALLRAAGVPARYGHGTVQITMEQAMNWLGAASAEMVQDILSQGGVPNAAIFTNGALSGLRFEHVWVIAYVDFVPSRGAKNGAGDNWIPMDAAFKKFTEKAGTNLLRDVSFDAQSLYQTILPNYQPGQPVVFDQDLILTRLESLNEEINAYVAAHGGDPSPDTMAGSREISTSVREMLAAGLPYTLVATRFEGPELSSRLRHSITVLGYNSRLDQALESPDFSYTIALSQLNYRRLGITYRPASTADADIWQSYIDQGSSTIPLYLINVRPVLQLDGVDLTSGSARKMGSAQYLDLVLKNTSDAEVTPYATTVGDETVIGVNGNGITTNLPQDRLDRVPSDNAAENLHQVALHYWMEYDYLDKLQAKGSGLFAQRMPSAGLFSSPLTVNYFFGLPRTGTYASRVMDIKSSIVGVAGKTAAEREAFTRLSGVNGSFLEGSIFGQLFHKGSGISAVQVLMDAAWLKIPMREINASNLSEALAGIQLDSKAETDIRNAVNAGLVAIAPDREIAYDTGWSGSGYIIFDPQTGGGAYMISGGLAGGVDIWCNPQPIPILEFVLIAILVVAIIALLVMVVGPAITALGSLIPVFGKAVLAMFVILFATTSATAGGLGFCIDQLNADNAWCDRNKKGFANLACKDRAFWNFHLCNRGCPLLPRMPEHY